ncbi:MAG: hypothetical protein QNK23_15985 [Crocinitomicaceae bacterium]|nr:hypothetical protein [Crocinitomicaceae bacterium]
MNTFLLISIAFLTYISFGLGFLFLVRKLRTAKRTAPLIIVPIAVSFISGVSILLYAVSNI